MRTATSETIKTVDRIAGQFLPKADKSRFGGRYGFPEAWDDWDKLSKEEQALFDGVPDFRMSVAIRVNQLIAAQPS